MNPLPKDLAAVRKIYFIAEDATGPFRRVVQFLMGDGKIISFEGKTASKELIRWLYDHNIDVAKRLEALFSNKDEQSLEVVVFRNEHFGE
jgi:hypothetical protein